MGAATKNVFEISPRPMACNDDAVKVHFIPTQAGVGQAPKAKEWRKMLRRVKSFAFVTRAHLVIARGLKAWPLDSGFWNCLFFIRSMSETTETGRKKGADSIKSETLSRCQRRGATCDALMTE